MKSSSLRSTELNEASGALSHFEQMRLATDVIRHEAGALTRLADQLPIDFVDAVRLILNCKGSLIVTGVGKAGWIGQKISATFASLGTRSHFVHPSEAIHGDLGRIGTDDVILIFSNSGETKEVIQILPTLEKLSVPMIAVTARENSSLSKRCDAVLNYGKTEEACPLQLAPTTSTTVMLSLGDALALVTSKMKRFRQIDFAKNHPGGSLGKRLSMVDEVMRPLDECRIAFEEETVRDVYIRLGGNARRAGAVLITDSKQRLTGIFTDSDLAKLLEQQLDGLFDQPIANVMTQNPVTVLSGEKTLMAIETFACRNLSELPVVDRAGRLKGIVLVTDVVNVQ